MNRKEKVLVFLATTFWDDQPGATFEVFLVDSEEFEKFLSKAQQGRSEGAENLLSTHQGGYEKLSRGDVRKHVGLKTYLVSLDKGADEDTVVDVVSY